MSDLHQGTRVDVRFGRHIAINDADSPPKRKACDVDMLELVFASADKDEHVGDTDELENSHYRLNTNTNEKKSWDRIRVHVKMPDLRMVRSERR